MDLVSQSVKKPTTHLHGALT